MQVNKRCHITGRILQSLTKYSSSEGSGGCSGPQTPRERCFVQLVPFLCMSLPPVKWLCGLRAVACLALLKHVLGWLEIRTGRAARAGLHGRATSLTDLILLNSFFN